MMSDVILMNSDNIIKVVSLKDGETGAYINDATVSVTLKDSSAVDVVGETWPLTMSYVTGSDGQYKATLIDTLTLTQDAEYTEIVTIVSGVLDLQIERTVIARKAT